MSQSVASNFTRVWVCSMLLLVSACVTTEGRVFTNEASPEKALETRLQLARSYIGEQNWGDAKRNLKIAAQIDRNAPEVHEVFGLYYQSTGEYELAEKSFKSAIAKKKDFSRARNNYAAFLYQQQRFQEAEDQLEVVVLDALYESRPQAYLNLGLCRLRLQDNQGAKDAFTRVLKMDRTNAIAMFELAQLEYQAENWSTSQRYYDGYRGVAKRQSARALWLGVRLSEKLNNADAEASYALALRNLFPNSAEFQASERAIHRGEL
ncbi:MAG: type IV pilus biogenesis/stability protein PilW [Gammaproteobacteria bacterium]|nr:type IV pilus biogenesis/stability protein PilW [Gammaproteobacteria bacterium]